MAATTPLECRVLGEPEIRVAGVAVPLRAAKVKALVAALLLRADRVASVDGLLDDLWPEGCPRSAVANLRTYATQLRRCLPHGRLQTVGSGYRLVTHDHELDLGRARELAARARRAVDEHDLPTALALLEAACAEWRGTPLDGLTLGRRLEAMRTALEEEHRASVELRLRVALAVHRGGEVVPLARAHAAAHPLVESAQEVLMLTLWHVGDHAGALHAYAAARTALVEEVGIEPGAALRRLQRGILRGDGPPSALPGVPGVAEIPSPRRSVEGATTVAASDPQPRVVVPHEVPARPRLFLGADEVVARGVRALCRAGGSREAPVVVAVHGPPGAGTSSVVAAVARSVAGEYPDGQVYLDLQHGRRHPASLVEGALRSLGADLGVAAPLRADAPARLRSILHGRRVLLVVDNVTDPAQVLPLLPGDEGSAVLLACRAVPAALVSAVDFPVPPLGAADAIRLFQAAARRPLDGPQRDVVAHIVELCGHRPGRVAAAGARLAGPDGTSLRELVRSLEESARSPQSPCDNVVALPFHDHPEDRRAAHGDGEILAAVLLTLGLSSRADLTDLASSGAGVPEDVVAEARDRLTALRHAQADTRSGRS